MLAMMAESSSSPVLGRGTDSVTSSSSSPVNVSSTSISPPHSSPCGYSSSVRQIMLSQYSPWVNSTYGDSAKTKTITARKYARILSQLRSSVSGDSSEDSKFKLWVKTKGFTLGPPSGHPDAGKPESLDLLYIPTGTDKASDGKVHFVYKKVAMVEQFFDIIYSVHVESAMDTQLRGRSGKHCGQKRTYRAVADQYAFIPREAISKFLLYCVDCQRKNFGESRRHPNPKKSKQAVQSSPMEGVGQEMEGSLAEEAVDESRRQCISPDLCPSAAAAAALSQAVVATMHSLVRTPLIQAHPTILATRAAAALIRSTSNKHPPAFNNNNNKIHSSTGDIDLSLPITSTYLRRMRALGLAAGLELQKENNSVDSSDNTGGGRIEDLEEDEDSKEKRSDLFVEEEEEEEGYVEEGSSSVEGEDSKCSSNPLGLCSLFSPGIVKAKLSGGEVEACGKMSQLSTLLSSNGSAMNLVQQQQSGFSEGAVIEAVAQDDASSNGAKDDEDEDEDDDMGDDRMEGIICGDPEKLKAFNMFVRLFVDENLDRHVPISKQPKEKIQAIIDSCTRQFPEHACRARKRIRTYLKSCRRTKRTREQAGLDPTNTRPTPPHLTSVQAEQLLARACENESENAKRMRMGMEPISQPMPVYTTSSECPIDVVSTVNVNTNTTSSKADHQQQQQQLAATLLAASQGGPLTEGKPVGPIFPTMNGNTISAVSTSAANTATLYRQPFPAGTAVFPTVVTNPPPILNLQAHQPAPTTTTTSVIPQNGPLVNETGVKKSPLLNHKLNTTEMAAVRQLITGYRESAAFLLRSADELEQLLQIQPKL